MDNKRTNSYDVCRGIGILLILFSNAVMYAYVHVDYSAMGVVDRAVFLANDVLAGGSSRFVFCILFGAGVLLFTEKYGGRTIHSARMYGLFLFGVVNYLVFQSPGDILIVYSVAGSLVYFVRSCSAATLLSIAVMVSSVFYALYGQLFYSIETAWIELNNGNNANWDAMHSESANRLALLEQLRSAGISGGYGYIKETYITIIAVWAIYYVAEAFVMMCVGMALVKCGYFSKAAGWHVKVLVVLGSMGVGINSFNLHWQISHEFDQYVSLLLFFPGYRIGNLLVAIAILSGAVVWLASARGSWLIQKIATVGRMSLSNYLGQSALMFIVFQVLGGFGQYSMSELALFVGCCWIMQIVISDKIWKKYGIGPAEWLLKNGYARRDIPVVPDR